MDKLETLDDYRYIFGWIFITSNRVDALLQKEFNEFDITTKQWFLSIILDNLFDTPPTIKELAKKMGSSHQNVKQIALKLEQKGLLILEKDKSDARSTRLILTEKAYEFWKGLKEKGDIFTSSLFKDINGKDLAITRKVMEKILLNITELDNERSK